MASVKTHYTLVLDVYEAEALKTLLGSMNDEEFAQFGVKGEDRARMGEIWALLPFREDRADP